MGNASSKAVRKLPKRAETPTWAGARAPNPSSTPTDTPKPEMPRASATKNDAIERDSRDPQLIANMNSLGPVKVNHNMQSIRPENQANRMHQSRIQSEVEANPSHPTRNRILSSTLSSLLDARKTASSRAELERIANEYGVDIAKLESLARFVNTPSIDEGSRKKTVDDEGAELVTSEAIWKERA